MFEFLKKLQPSVDKPEDNSIDLVPARSAEPKEALVESTLPQSVERPQIVIDFPDGMRPVISINNWSGLNMRMVQNVEHSINRKLHSLRVTELHKLDAEKTAGDPA